jgi:hypothetical protein
MSGNWMEQSYTFLINDLPGSENEIRVESVDGVVSVYVNETQAAESITGWPDSGEISVGPRDAVITPDFDMKASDLRVEYAWDVNYPETNIKIRTDQENSVNVETEAFKTLSAKLANPLTSVFLKSRERIDFGIRVYLPWSRRILEIKVTNDSSDPGREGHYQFDVSLTPEGKATASWDQQIQLPTTASGEQFDILINVEDGAGQLLLDWDSVPGYQQALDLTETGIDFNTEDLQNVTFFTNSSGRTLDTAEAQYFTNTFASPPYLAVTDFSLSSNTWQE